MPIQTLQRVQRCIGSPPTRDGDPSDHIQTPRWRGIVRVDDDGRAHPGHGDSERRLGAQLRVDLCACCSPIIVRVGNAVRAMVWFWGSLS